MCPKNQGRRVPWKRERSSTVTQLIGKASIKSLGLDFPVKGSLSVSVGMEGR